MVAKQQQRKRARKPRKQARKKVYKLEPYERYRTISGAPTAADILALQQAQMAQQSALNTQANLTAERVRQEYEAERRQREQREQRQREQDEQIGLLEAFNQRIGHQEAEQQNILQRLAQGEQYISPRFRLLEQYGRRIRALEEEPRNLIEYEQVDEEPEQEPAAAEPAAAAGPAAEEPAAGPAAEEPAAGPNDINTLKLLYKRFRDQARKAKTQATKDRNNEKAENIKIRINQLKAEAAAAAGVE
jgi:hypothetical protein